MPVSRFAVDEPVSGRFDVVVAPQGSVHINYGWIEREVLLEEGLLGPWVFHDEAEAPFLCYAYHLDSAGEEKFAVRGPLEYRFNPLVRRQVDIVPMRVADEHLAHAGEIDAGEEGDYQIIWSDGIKD